MSTIIRGDGIAVNRTPSGCRRGQRAARQATWRDVPSKGLAPLFVVFAACSVRGDPSPRTVVPIQHHASIIKTSNVSTEAALTQFEAKLRQALKFRFCNSLFSRYKTCFFMMFSAFL